MESITGLKNVTTKIKQLLSSESFWQLVRYGLIGILGLFVDTGVFYLLTTFGPSSGGFPYLYQFISGSCGVTNNFFWNSYANFKVSDHMLRRYVQYYLIGQTTTIFVWLMLLIFSTWLGFSVLWVKAISTVVATLLQFIVNKYVTFKK